MQVGNKFRCYPTPAQEQTLLQWIGCQRNIYNAKVQEDQYFRRFARKSLQHAGQTVPIDQQYSQFKTDLAPWLSEVPSVVLRNGAVLWKQAYSRYFSRLGGRPVIHRKHDSQPIRFKPIMRAWRWHVSFRYDDGFLSQPTRTQLTDKDTADWLTQFNKTALSKTAVQADHESLPPGET
jgi:putative transposase